MAGQDSTRVTMEMVRAANAAIGHHFFDASSMRFFDSRAPRSTVDGSRYFVTSERFDYSSPRLFTVRYASVSGEIDTVGEFQGYASRAAAVAAARRVIRSGEDAS